MEPRMKRRSNTDGITARQEPRPTGSSRGHEAQISSEKEAVREPPHVGCYFLNRLPAPQSYWLSVLYLEHFTRLGHAGGGAAILAGRDAGQGHQCTPAEGGPGGGEFFGDGAVILFGVQRAVLAHGVAQEQIEHRTRGMAELTVPMHDGRGAGLEVLADGIVGFAQERVRVGGFDLLDVELDRERVPVQKIAAARRAVERGLIRAEDEASESVAGVAHAGQVAPRARRIAGVHANAVAMHAAERLAGHLVARPAAHVAEEQLI